LSRRPPTLRTRLLVVVACSIVPAFVMVFALINYYYEQDRAQLAASTISTARAMTNALDLQLSGIQASMASLATSRLLKHKNFEEFYLQAQEVGQLLNVNNVVLSHPEGGQIFNTLKVLESSPRVSQVVVPTPAVDRVLRSGNPGVTDLFYGEVIKRPVIAVVVPVIYDGKLAYRLSAGIDLNQLQASLQRQRLPPDWVAAITDSRGVIVARTRDQEKFVGQTVRAALLARMGEVGEDAVESTTLDGVPVLTAFSHSGVSNWSVLIGVPRASLTSELQRSLLWLLAGTLVLLTATSALAWRLGDAIVQSVQDLADAVAAMGSGARARIPDMSFREAQTLALAFERSSSLVRAAQDEAAEHEAQLRAILESAMDAIIVTDAAQHIILFNAAACHMFGYEPEQALGSDIGMLMPERLRDHSLVPAAAGLEPYHGSEAASLMTGLRRNGSEFPMNASVSFASQGHQHFYTVILRDITQELQSREALVRNNMDLQQFAFVASHDLRSPLRSVKGYLGMLLSRHSDSMAPKAQDLLRRADTALDQLNHLTEDLLRYARLGETATALAPVDCNALVQEVLSLHDAAITESGAQVEVGPLPTLEADRVQMIQLFLNLLGNAIKYRSEHAPRIRISARRGPGDWEFSIEDNGIGIDTQHQNRIFEIFKRLHTTQEYPGSGIGLAVCQRVVQRHGGRIWVTSEPGRGSTFHFTIADFEGNQK
jgi:PAS domain S-box-containing protein